MQLMYLDTLMCSGREALDKSLASGAAALKRVQELEAELQQLRASSSVMSLFQLPTKEDVLAGGLVQGHATAFSACPAMAQKLQHSGFPC
jgi:hypothetical protein